MILILFLFVFAFSAQTDVMRPANSCAARRRQLRSSSGVAAAVALVAVVSLTAAAAAEPDCSGRLTDSLRAEIAGYRPAVERVLSYVRDDDGYRGRTWASLARFVDAFGSRLAGTPNLERAIDYAMDALRAGRLDDVHAENVSFTGWQR